MLGPLEEMLVRANGSLTVSREELDLVHRNTLRLLKLVNTLLDFSRIEACRIEAVYEPTDLAAYTAELASVFRSAIERAGLQLSVDCSALPEPVYVDREMWEKIVLNLLSNAFKFTFAGEVTVGLRWCGERVALTVADTGVGIPESELPHIFERFHRVRDARSRTHEGTGIGLALVKELVKFHGGDVTVESAEGRGTTFFVSIPTGAGHLPKERIGIARTLASTATGATPFAEEALRWLPSNAECGMRIAESNEPASTPHSKVLVADDNADMRQYVQRLLADRYTVTTVADGVAALDAAQGEPPDLILADVMMPNLDGFGLLRAVRDDVRLAGVPVVLLSARAGEEATVEGMQAGADDYLIKPFSAQELLARIDTQVRRSRAEEALGQSEERFRLLVEGVKDYAIFMLDPDGRVMTWNDGAERIKGYRLEEILGQHFSLFYDPDNIQMGKPEQGLQAAAATGRFEDEGWRIRKDGSRFWANVIITALQDETGKLQGFAKVIRDMTERKQVEQQLRRSEAYLAEAQRLSHTGSWVWNVSTGALFWSQEHFRIFGLDSEQAKPSYDMFFHMVHPEDRPSTKAGFDRAIRDRSDYEMECRIVRPDGSVRHLHSISHPVFNESGALTEYVGTVIDITEHKLAEEALHEARAALAHITRVMTMGELIATIAHEVNQPLGAIVTNGQACLRLLARELPDLDKSREVVKRMISDGLRASEVITRMRALLKKRGTEKALLNVNEIIQEVITLTSTELSKSEIHLQTTLAADLPQVLGDRVQLQQVILNLILNAKEAMRGAGWKPRELLITSLASRSGEAVVAVRDSGTGLDPQDCDRIFEAFFTTKAEGLGLGLSISRTIIEAHGGRLWATPNEDQDTTIQFALPASGGEDEESR